MPGTMRWNVKDADGRWFTFDQQQKGSSCGPACVKIIKESVSGQRLGEDAERGITALFKHGMANTGVGFADVSTASHNWDRRGARTDELVSALKAQPAPVKTAMRAVGPIDALILGANRHHPAMLKCNWDRGSFHWIVSMGRTKANPNVATILDPTYGLGQIDVTDIQGGKVRYHGSARAHGSIVTGIST